MRTMQLKMLILLPMLAVIFAKVHAAPTSASDNNEMLKQILQVVQEQAEQMEKKLDDEKTSLLEISTKVEHLKTEDNFLLSVLTGQQTQLASKIDKVEQTQRQNQDQLKKHQEQIRTDIHAHDTKLSKITNKLACQIAQHGLKITTLEGKQYFFSYDQPRKTWSEAQTFCRLRLMDLVSVETQDEWRVLQPEVEKLGIKFDKYFPWSSATDSAQKGNWTWSSGHDVTFHARNNMDNRDNQNCMYLYTDYWREMSCSAKTTFICEVDSVCLTPS